MTPTMAGGELPEVTLSLQTPPSTVNHDPAWEAYGEAFAVGDLVVGYFHSEGGRNWVQAVDGRTGEPRWKLPAGVIPDWRIPLTSTYSATLEHDGGATLYIVGPSEDDNDVASLYGIDVATGQPTFETELPADVNEAYIAGVTPSAILVYAGRGTYSTFDPKSGAALVTAGKLAFAPHHWVTETTLVDAGASDGSDPLRAYDLRTGEEVWSTPANVTGLVVYYAGKRLVVYAGRHGDGEQETVVVEARTGEILQPVKSQLSSCTGESSSTFVCSTVEESLIGFDAETGEQKWITEPTEQAAVFDSQSVIAGNALYLFTGEVIDLSSGAVVTESGPCVLRVGNGFMVSSCIDSGSRKEFRVFTSD